MADPIRVLCVDDDADFLDTTAAFVEQYGFDVLTETSVPQALERLDREAIDCIVSDYRMLEIDGLEFLDAVRTSHPELPFILFTEVGSEEIVSEAISAGVTDYLRKESTTQQYDVLTNRIENAVEKRRAERDRHHREYTLRALHDATGELVRAHTEEAVAECAVEAAADVLGFSIATVRLYDSETDRLEPAASTDATTALLGERPVYRNGEGLPWQAFSSTEPILAGGSATVSGANELPLESTMYLSIGEHGTFSIGAEHGEFTDSDIRLAQLLAANTETALERVSRERLLRERETELERQNQRLEEFASVVSHDLRNPLGVARGRLELARDENPSEHHADIEWALSRMDSLIEDLLALARQGEVVGESTDLPLEEIAQTAWMGVEHESASLTLDSLGTLEADAERLRRLLENLFRNAIEHGGPEVSVRVGRSSAGFFVADDGPGIPESERGQVFESGHSTGNGTGLGLAIVRTIAEAHGWNVSVSVSDTGGARFDVRI